MTPSEMAGFTRAMIKRTGERAVIQGMLETSASLAAFARSGRMAAGPKAKRGSRSHQAWRDIVAGGLILEGALHAVSAGMYFAIVTSRGD